MKLQHTIGACLTSGVINATPDEMVGAVGGGQVDVVTIVKLVISALPVIIHAIGEARSRRRERKRGEK